MSDVWSLADLPPKDSGGFRLQLPAGGIALVEIERQAIIEALKMSNWVQKDAAELLAISPRVINYKIQKLGIRLEKVKI